MKVTARVQRSGDWWAVEVPEVPGVFTQAKRLDQVADQVADAVATMLDLESVSEVDVALAPVLDAEIATGLAAAKQAGMQAARAQVEASRAMRTMAAKLRAAQLSTRDVAVLLGVSHQRVAQLVKSVNEKGVKQLAKANQPKKG